jgi:tetratricopeptide (TPR) repeat protein
MAIRAAVTCVFVLAALAAPAARQSPLGHVHVRVALADYREAIARYRAGRTADALVILETRTAFDWRDVVRGVLVELREQTANKKPLHLLDVSPFKTDLAHNLSLARSAAALHMEAALSAYGRDVTTSRHEFDGHVGWAEQLFAFVATQDGVPTAAPRWELVLGLTAAAEGRFGWAAQILDAACKRFPEDGPLQLARGSVHETIAGMPASQMATGPAALVGWGFSAYGNQLSAARSAREARLDTARDSLQRALTVLPDSAEARIRLARVRFLQGNQKTATQLLMEVIEERAPASGRERYLARLFLGRLHERQDRLEDAARLFEDALTINASGQSAFVALAEVTRRRGDAGGAVRMSERMLAAPRPDDDPWTGYRFAQYFVRDDLLAQLRKEARQ